MPGGSDESFEETAVADADAAIGAPLVMQETVDSLGPPGASVADGDTPGLGEAGLIGDYFVLQRVGAGAMGTVYAAYDPELDRKVAIKVLKERSGRGSIGRKRLQREARALARLQHPNVVTVHGVGEHDGSAWVAMEFVEGKDLADWISTGPHAWAEVLDVFLGAGRGLAAAHKAGVVHRDFKPGNVLIGNDGVARVADFGLARPSEDPISDESHDGNVTEPAIGQSASPISWGEGEQSLTRTRGVVGTPLYMAPEQHLGSKVGPAADQYAFCLSMYEALYGELPFDAASMFALLEAKNSAEIKAAPSGVEVPKWLRKIVVRGLAVEPDARFSSMDALLDEIDVQRRRAEGLGRRRLVMVGALVGALGAGTFGWYAASAGGAAAPAADPCLGATDPVAEIWNDGRRARIEAAFMAVDVPYAKKSWERADAFLSDYAQKVEREHLTLCREDVAGQRTRETAQLAEECLARTRDGFDFLLSVLEEPNPTALENIGELVAKSVPPVEECRNPLLLIAPANVEMARERFEIVDAIDRIYTLRLAGKGDEAKTLAEGLTGRVDTVRDPLARGELRRLVGNELPVTNPRHIELLYGAMADGIRARAFALTVMAGLDVASAHGFHQRFQQALWTLDEAEAAWDALMASTPKEGARPLFHAHRAHIEVLRGDMLKGMGRTQEAVEAGLRGLELWDAVESDGYGGFIIAARNNLAEAMREVGRKDEAFTLYAQALEQEVRNVGEVHPRVATILNNRGAAFIEYGQFEEGVADLDRARAIEVELNGAKNFNVGLIDFNLALVDLMTGDPEAAAVKLANVKDVWTGKIPPQHPFWGIVASGEGMVARQRGELERAHALGEQAIAQLSKGVGEHHVLTATALADFSLTLTAQGEYDRAEEFAERAQKAFEASAGLDNPNAAAAFFARGEALARRGGARDRGRAREQYERATEIQGGKGSDDHPELAWSYVGLAELALQDGDDELAGTWLERAKAVREGFSNPDELGRRIEALTVSTR